MHTILLTNFYPLVNIASSLVIFISSLYVYLLLFRYRSRIGENKVAGQDIGFVRTAIVVFALIVASNGIGHLVSSISSLYSCEKLVSLERIISALILAPSAIYLYSVSSHKEKSIYEIMRSAKKYETVFYNAPVGLAIVSSEGHPVEMNDNFSEYLGYTKSQLQGIHFKDFTHPDDVDKDLELFGELMRGEREDYTMTKRYLHGETGEVLHAKLGVFVIRNGITEVVATITDISAEMRASEEIEEEARELEILSRELERFAYVSSHDLQEPLRTVKMFSGMLKDSLGDRLQDDELEYLSHIQKASTRMQSLIKDLLEYSRLSRNGDSWRMIHMQDVFMEALSSLTSLSIKKLADVDVSMRGLLVYGNEVQLISLAANLLSNAMKFHCKDKAPVVTAGYYQYGDCIVYYVEDNGIGIEEEYHSKVFDVFSRLHSQDDYSGTGIGLSICDKIVKSHGGQIWIEGNKLGGTTVKFTLG